MDNKYSSIEYLKGIKLLAFAPLSGYTTWHVGGPAEWLAEPTSIDELQRLIDWAYSQKMPIRTIGAGSNLLISDSGLKGLSICMKKMNQCTINSKNVLLISKKLVIPRDLKEIQMC